MVAPAARESVRGQTPALATGRARRGQQSRSLRRDRREDPTLRGSAEPAPFTTRESGCRGSAEPVSGVDGSAEPVRHTTRIASACVTRCDSTTRLVAVTDRASREHEPGLAVPWIGANDARVDARRVWRQRASARDRRDPQRRAAEAELVRVRRCTPAREHDRDARRRARRGLHAAAVVGRADVLHAADSDCGVCG